MAERDNFSAFDDDLGDEDPMGVVLPKTEPRSEAPEEIQRLREERDRANELRDEAIRGMLANRPTAEPQTAEPRAQSSDDDFIKQHLPEDADDDVVALLTPVLKAYRGSIEEDMEKRYGPIAETVERQEDFKLLKARVPGFTEDLLPEIKKLYDQLPPVEREEYDTRTGIEALARRVLESNRGRADMSGMAHSEHPAAPPTRDPGAGPTEADVWALSDEQFDEMIAKVKYGGGSR